MYVYFYSLHVSGSHVRIVRTIIVSMRHLVYVTLCRWPSGMQVKHVENRNKHTWKKIYTSSWLFKRIIHTYVINILHSPSCKTHFALQTFPTNHPAFKQLHLLLRKHAIKSANSILLIIAHVLSFLASYEAGNMVN